MFGVSSSSADKNLSHSFFKVSDSRISSTTKIVRSESKPNPSPLNYEILRCFKARTAFAIEIQYKDCHNYEGRKILVFKGQFEDLLAQKLIDPHFSENKNFMSPYARFEPTGDGWMSAVRFVYRNCLLYNF